MVRYRDIGVKEALALKDAVFVDVRSPHEYEEFHIPGAVNVPLFQDEEKKLIGFVYRNKGEDEAKRLGYELASKRLEEFYKKFKELKGRYKNVVVYCWRGGMRSRGMCEAMANMGLELLRLEGGYRAYRQFILKDMERLLESVSFIVLTGRTGVGKTRLLRKLRSGGYPVIDLEELAKDRGSVFGSVGIRDKVSQKMFDSLLYESLRKYEGEVVFIEDESKWIGNVHIPEAFWKRKLEGVLVEITASLDKRVELILREYTAREGWRQECISSLVKIKKYLGNERFRLLKELIEEGKERETVRLLIEEYYDKKYKLQGKAEYIVDAEDEETAFSRLEELHRKLSKATLSLKPSL